MTELLTWSFKKIILPWLIKEIIKQSWDYLKQNPYVQRMIIIYYLKWLLTINRPDILKGGQCPPY